jgi:hypothetical protein
MIEANRYDILHRHLDEVVAKFLANTGKVPSQATVLELLQWTYRQNEKQRADNEFSKSHQNSENRFGLGR